MSQLCTFALAGEIGKKSRSKPESSKSPSLVLDVSAIFARDRDPLPELRIRKAGCVSCIVPLKYPTSPDSMTRMPVVSPFLMYFALKKVAVTLGRRSPRVMTRYSRLGLRLVHRTSALVMVSTKVMCSPSSGGSLSSPSTVVPVLYLRG